MFLSLFGGNSFTDLIGSPTFWIGVAIVAILIVLIIFSLKYPKIGGPALLGISSFTFIVLSIWCGTQLHYYYKAEGGIHGKITGIFKTNEVEVVDNMSFEFKNIELTETSSGEYSAGMTIDKVISLDTKNSLGVFVNGMPCDITSEVHTDFAVAKYVYTFYDNNKTKILTDTLTLNFAFYENSTYLSLSTSGGAEAIKYWHYYFNKNGFVVEIGPFNDIAEDIPTGTGDVSNFAVVRYLLDGEEYLTKVYNVGETLELPMVNDNYMNWYVDNELVTEDFVLTNSIFVEAYTGDVVETYTVAFLDGTEGTQSRVAVGSKVSFPEALGKESFEFVGWSTSKSVDDIVENSDYTVFANITFTAIYRTSILIPTEYPLAFTLSTVENDYSYKTFDFSSVCDSSSLLNCGLEFSLELKYTATVDAGTAEFDISITKATTEYWMESVIGGYFPVELTADNKLLLGKRDVGVNYTFSPGTHRFEITEIYVYSK